MLCDSQMCKISWTKTNLTLTWLGFCQNPNLTTTQPQPNLNLVGFETIITLHTPYHHPPTTTGALLLPEIMILGVWNFVGDITKQN